MAGRFKIDEDVSEDLLKPLLAAGHDATTVHLQHWTGSDDTFIWPEIQREARTLITADKGFGILATRTAKHWGLVLLRPEWESRTTYIRLLELALATRALDDMRDKVVVVTEGGVRVRGKLG